MVVDPVLEEVVVAYGAYQLRERRLAESTVEASSYAVRAFLAWRAAKAGCDLARLAPAELGEYVVQLSCGRKVTSVGSAVTTLRRFCRFLYATGVTERDLSGAVPSVPSSRFAALPRGVDVETVRLLLASCDRARATGRRDYAVLMLMWRLGLRAVEVARLRLDDLDWRAGEIAVSGKAGRVDRLPLPADVGAALADYLRFGRPVSDDRAVFLRAWPPPVGMSRNAVVFVSRTASTRAGVAVVGGHKLRHTTATELLGRGASLQEIGQVLRHDDATTTAIYAKVDQGALSGLVRPWPEGVGR
jgi:site-specific recombinase XerD